MMQRPQADVAPRFGVCLPHGWRSDLPAVPPTEQWDHIRTLAARAEALGYDSVWLVDHLQPVVDPAGPLFECWTTTVALAVTTTRIRIGQMATCNAYRPPALLAKMASTVDVMSHGRIDLGLGAGWFEPEHRAWGYDYPSAKVRLDRLEEAARLILRLWTSSPASFSGQHYVVDGVEMAPRPVQHPHPPLWIAGGGERRTLRLAARYGSWCNVAGSVATVARKAAVLAEHCNAVGRDAAEVGISWKGDVVIGTDAERIDARVADICRFWGSRGHPQLADPARYREAHLVGRPEEIRARVREYQEAGCEYFLCDFSDVNGDALDRFADDVVAPLASAAPVL
jgi:F420-dependent oxidoreductase-like protein